MNNLDSQTQEKLKELQVHEQNMRNILMQKQAFEMELSETENALHEVSSTKDTVYKLIGNILVKSDKNKIEDDLKKKKELLSLRIKSIQSQHTSIENQLDSLKKEVLKKIK